MRCAVLGSPVGHSLSPVLHRAAYAELGLGWEYDRVEVGESDLPGFLDGLDEGWRGLSLTMPLKRTVVGLLHEAEELVRRTGVANTVVLERGRRAGANTDVPGAAAALRERGVPEVGSAVVLGGGATALSVAWALADLGCAEIAFAARDAGRVRPTVEVLARHDRPPRARVLPLAEAAETARTVDLLVSTVPTGPAAALAERLYDVPDPASEAPRAVFDVVYAPWPTPLGERARAAGATVVSGLDLLVHQAVAQVGLMTGCDPVRLPALVAPMRAAAEWELGRR